MESLALFFKKKRVAYLLFLLPAHLFSSQLNELRTVGLAEDSIVNIKIFQRFYASQGEWIFQRDQIITFSLERWVEFGVNLSHLNYITRSEDVRTRFGDIKVFLNFATDWFLEYIVLNYYLEYNTGSGPDYTDINNHPLEAYGHEEWRTGLILFKSFSSIHASIHFNLFYVFRSESEPTLFNSFLDEDTLNIFAEEAYNRGLGFNPVNENTFFYYENFSNDNLEINFGVNTDIWYPFVPFVELTTSFHFRRDFPRRAPGSGIMKNQISFGSKFFLEKNQFFFKAAIIVPIPPLNEIYDIGGLTGFGLEF